MKSQKRNTPKNKPSAKFIKPKEIKVVTKKVLNQIADGIYDPKTGHYLNLCSGFLQNGPDPACQTRSMHCGLGELYFVVTGRQPQQDKVDEGWVVEEIISRSTIGEHAEIYQKKIDKLKKTIQKLSLNDDMIDDLNFVLSDYLYDECEEEYFRAYLSDIPNENDLGEKNNFKSRAKRVADKLREAAKLLPR